MISTRGRQNGKDILNEQLLRIALKQSTNPALSGNARRIWFNHARAAHMSRSVETVRDMERGFM